MKTSWRVVAFRAMGGDSRRSSCGGQGGRAAPRARGGPAASRFYCLTAGPMVRVGDERYRTSRKVWRHPADGSHESSVQDFPSSQSTGVLPPQIPSVHVSPVVQAFPSSHEPVMGACAHPPVTGSQVSSVQGLPSSQAGVPRQIPSRFPHMSPVVHMLLSLQGTPAGRNRATAQRPARHSSMMQSAGFVSQDVPLPTLLWTQPPRVGSQTSNVQTLWSSHTGGSRICRQPVLSLKQTSDVHAMPSSQSLAVPMQFPPLQTSFAVQKLPSLQGPVAAPRVQAPVAGSQASTVQALPSSQSTGAAADSHLAAWAVYWV